MIEYNEADIEQYIGFVVTDMVDVFVDNYDKETDTIPHYALSELSDIFGEVPEHLRFYVFNDLCENLIKKGIAETSIFDIAKMAV